MNEATSAGHAAGHAAAHGAAQAADSSAWHAATAEEALTRLDANLASGLSAAEVETRRAQHGPNRLPEAGRQSLLRKFLGQFHNILVYVLLGAGFVKLMLGLWVDASVIFGVVVINALLGFVQEGKAEKALDSIRNMLSAEARTLRGGETRMIPSEDLVPGDIVLLESGDKVPADLRLVDVKNLRAEEAALTGESVPTDKSVAPAAENATVGDRHGMAYSGTLIVSGRATGVVVATGSHTELGRINQMLANVDALETPLLRQIRKFGYAITVAIFLVSALVFAYGHWIEELPFVQLFQAVVGIAVSIIPEGLPAIITITLAIGVQRMAQRNAIIRRLPAVETLGSVSRICSDKTGTLTLMEMMVVSAATADAAYEFDGAGYAPEGRVLRDGQPAGPDPVLDLMARVSVLCNDAELRQQDGVWKVEGDPTEGALYPFAAKIGVARDALEAAFRRVDVIPFESEHRFMATLNEDAHGASCLLVKGAPEVILEHCDRQQTRDGPRPLDAAFFQQASDRLAAQGERVLALAWLDDPRLGKANLAPADLPATLVLLGLIGLLDPPRKEAIESVRECHAGGIRVTMITGDHRITAAAVARMIGIGDGKTALTGVEIEAMDTAALQDAVKQVDVFARASPEHKLRLVKAMQANNQIVAMTGDGVNDAPALKKADIGVAMGIKGTEVTREAAAMVLADDNFASITAAVREGRTVYNNIEKAILFMLPTNVAQGVVIMAAIFGGFTMPITTPQVLWVNMVTSVTLGLVISFEPHEPDVMRRPPAKTGRPILTGFGIWRVIFVGLGLLALTLAAFFWTYGQGVPIEFARTVAVNALTIGQIFYLLNTRYRIESSLSIGAHLRNRYLLMGIGAVIVLQLLFTYAPPLQELFGTAALPAGVWPWLFAGGAVFFLVVEAEKWVIRRWRGAKDTADAADTADTAQGDR
ncbi:HAD-IC family P-type ATPase [Paraburkholderia caballeronis]|uniref:ATPase, P-type (Transporting), HAD superfamily, subfamily IC n=1 Tax=Paraburkholderia caballeronis TaxID=416943 RepID=A0A1H7UAM4_9BURK|nr:HAD-IC family P-type ATPase [Paraburkholderia caballeronis]PXW23315.1 P-type E1-E2 ATPase [Paraburkholderia caballeronis]PXW98308.1 P-type E1-E2 ATPase [Paraburkholderia caballeronis]RAJ95038.1 P-type E1-E2 ATPase [Paraburkholderia caballeronis]SEC60346.1 ATPase, P-type (transporting), HAD superfamily, subfamily IC [Paraburkholderia caballeronis]SEL93738.1 ATPase, P-type (transporting), HAD superfamily, subfamily IC [Paraburkholderia caballeronis]